MSFSFYYLEVKIETLMCDILGIYHSAGKCLSNGRCLCWWGWTGSGACYVDGGAYNNRITVSVDLIGWSTDPAKQTNKQKTIKTTSKQTSANMWHLKPIICDLPLLDFFVKSYYLYRE